MALSAFINIATTAKDSHEDNIKALAKKPDVSGWKWAEGESKSIGYEKWTEIQGWDWEVEAESSWTKGTGSSVGKPNPGKLTFEHYYDKSSPAILKYISQGKAFPAILIHMCKATGKEALEPYFKVLLEDAFLTKVSHTISEEGNVQQKVELVFKQITIEYQPQDGTGNQVGQLTAGTQYSWDISTGKVT